MKPLNGSGPSFDATPAEPGGPRAASRWETGALAVFLGVTAFLALAERLFSRGRVLWAALSLAALAFAIDGAAAFRLLPAAVARQDIHRALAACRPLAMGWRPVYAVGVDSAALPFYLGSPVMFLANAGEASRLVRTRPGFLLIWEVDRKEGTAGPAGPPCEAPAPVSVERVEAHRRDFWIFAR